MALRLLVLFIVVPLVELYLLLRFASVTSIPTTVAVVLLTGIIGSMLAAKQGAAAIRNFQTAISQGRVPGPEVADGLLIVMAAALLLTPGLLTDSLGIIVLIPWFRRHIRNRIVKRYAGKFRVVTSVGGFSQGDFDAHSTGKTVDATFRPAGGPMADDRRPPLI